MSGSFLPDLGERVTRTFVQGALAALPPSLAFTDWNAIKVAGISALSGGVAAVLSLATSLIAKRVGSPDDASFLGGGTRDAG